MIHYANLNSEDGINTGAIFEGKEIYRSARLEALRKKYLHQLPGLIHRERRQLQKVIWKRKAIRYRFAVPWL